MQILQVYIEGQRISLFNDESVSITQTIQNVKDIGKIFTEFSQSFSLPATKENNKIFKHYYNYDIVNGFDARFKISATLELNNLPFKKGTIKLEGVDLKDNKPHTYRVTFFGGITTLKDLIGEDELSILSSLNSLSPIYDEGTLKNYLQLNPATNDVIVPLITHSQRLYYDPNQNLSDTGNLHWHTGSGTNLHGLLWSELKYALRVHNIVEAIESRYNLNFSDNFFNTTNPIYYDLFLWLHRKSGNVSQGTSIPVYTQRVTNFEDFTQGEYLECSDALGFDVVELIDNDSIDEFYFEFSRSNTNPVGVNILRNGLSVVEVTNITQLTRRIDIPQIAYGTGEFTVIFSFETAQQITTAGFYLTAFTGDVIEIDEQVETDGVINLTATFDFIITQQVPQIKILDFLTNLFKMFNLTSYVDDNNVIQILPLDDYYSTGNSYNITKYIDVNKSKVNIALPYKQVSFSYEDTKTLFASVHNQLENQQFSRVNYTQSNSNGQQVDGSLYSIKPSFSIMKYERIRDPQNISTTIQWGYSVNDDFKPYLGKPLLFYPVFNAIDYNSGETNRISYITRLNSDGTFADHEFINGSINMPSNYISFSADTETPTLNFNAEVNEYTGQTYTNTLFQAYYSNYITSVFNKSNRITKVSAYLPLRILLNYTLADRFVIGGNSYKINSITTNLETGKSELELLNEV